MKQGEYYHLNTRACGKRTPWSRHFLDIFPNVEGTESLDFDTLDDLKHYLIERYGKIPKGGEKLTDKRIGAYGIVYKHWVEESPNIYHADVTPMRFYKVESIIIKKVTYYEKYVML